MRYLQDFMETFSIFAASVVDDLFIVPISAGRTVLSVRATVLEPFDPGVTDITVGDDQDDDGFIPLRNPVVIDPKVQYSYFNSLGGDGTFAAGKHYPNPARLLVTIPGITTSAGKLRLTIVYSGDAVPPTRFD